MTKEEFDSISDSELANRFKAAFLKGTTLFDKQRYDYTIAANKRTIGRLQSAGVVQEIRADKNKTLTVFINTNHPPGPGLTQILFLMRYDESIQDGNISLEAPLE